MTSDVSGLLKTKKILSYGRLVARKVVQDCRRKRGIRLREAERLVFVLCFAFLVCFSRRFKADCVSMHVFAQDDGD